MALMQLGPNKYDIATPADVRAIVAESARERERARGVKDMRRSLFVQGTPASTRFTLSDSIGPASGYIWTVRLITVQLATAGTGQVYISSDTNPAATAAQQRSLLWAFGTSQQWQSQTLNSGAAILKSDEGLFFSFTQNITAYMLSGWQVPSEMGSKLL
jgi:hypothetical protein